ncbi:MAG TPA: hypothetical protein VEY07_04550 [Thermoplasmata archaeon]|nr:hypothetical protein [Thermoplasmata archaeon]
MPPNLRLSLTIFSIGFAIEAGIDLYHLITGSTQLIAGGSLFIIGGVATVVGLLFLWIGRHEWNELHQARVRHAHLTFLLLILLGAAAGGPVAWYLYRTPGSLPGWVPAEVGIAAGISVVVTVWLYVVIVLHLVGGGGKAVLGLSLVTSLVPAYLVATAIDRDLAGWVAAAGAAPASLASQVEPLFALFSWLFASYLLLLAAFADAHRRVARGLAAPT